jgi:hypothetical protein
MVHHNELSLNKTRLASCRDQATSAGWLDRGGTPKVVAAIIPPGGDGFRKRLLLQKRAATSSMHLHDICAK